MLRIKGVNRRFMIICFLCVILAGALLWGNRLLITGRQPVWRIKLGDRGETRISAPVAVNETLVFVAANDRVDTGPYAHYMQALTRDSGAFV
jgi:hypothetical protein